MFTTLSTTSIFNLDVSFETSLLLTSETSLKDTSFDSCEGCSVVSETASRTLLSSVLFRELSALDKSGIFPPSTLFPLFIIVKSNITIIASSKNIPTFTAIFKSNLFGSGSIKSYSSVSILLFISTLFSMSFFSLMSITPVSFNLRCYQYYIKPLFIFQDDNTKKADRKTLSAFHFMIVNITENFLLSF